MATCTCRTLVVSLVGSLVIALGAAGCQRSVPSGAGTVSQAASGERTFSIRGKVVRVTGDTVVLDHDNVPGFMGAMTMPYTLADPGVASELHPGDHLVAKIHVREAADGFHDPRLDEVVVTAQARPDYQPAVEYHVPAAGDQVPDFRLLDQSGRVIHLNQFRGKLLLMTFIYTRCTFADFCPRMSRNFAEIDQQLQRDPKLYNETHLLSVSFDPAYDTPAVLRSYGGAYTGRYTKETFAHWDFAAPPEKELPTMTQYFDVGITGSKSNPATHTLSTVLVGKDGRVIAWFPTNDWTPAEMIGRIKAAATAQA